MANFIEMFGGTGLAFLGAALAVGLLTVLFLQPYIFGPVTELLFGHEIYLAWPWWCPIGVCLSLLVCLSGKPENDIVEHKI